MSSFIFLEGFFSFFSFYLVFTWERLRSLPTTNGNGYKDTDKYWYI